MTKTKRLNRDGGGKAEAELAVPCAKCGAPAGEKCRNYRGTNKASCKLRLEDAAHSAGFSRQDAESLAEEPERHADLWARIDAERTAGTPERLALEAAAATEQEDRAARARLDHRDVECPRCKAPVGESCREKVRGRWSPEHELGAGAGTHLERTEAAAIAAGLPAEPPARVHLPKLDAPAPDALEELRLEVQDARPAPAFTLTRPEGWGTIQLDLFQRSLCEAPVSLSLV